MRRSRRRGETEGGGCCCLVCLVKRAQVALLGWAAESNSTHPTIRFWSMRPCGRTAHAPQRPQPEGHFFPLGLCYSSLSVWRAPGSPPNPPTLLCLHQNIRRRKYPTPTSASHQKQPNAYTSLTCSQYPAPLRLNHSHHGAFCISSLDRLQNAGIAFTCRESPAFPSLQAF